MFHSPCDTSRNHYAKPPNSTNMRNIFPLTPIAHAFFR